MFNLHKASARDLLTSGLYDEHSFYPALLRDLKRSKHEVIIESPCMTMPRTLLIKPTLKKLVKKGVKVRVHTRYPGHHDQLLRIQAWQATKELKQVGVKVRFFNDYHHRKLVIIDGAILYEGSLNVMSQNKSREIMRRIESEQLAQQMIRFLHLKPWYSYIL
jgi:phosphatidylserine/phosphatidylglycerophosphate/cardiolipin synthase-like enzyme